MFIFIVTLVSKQVPRLRAVLTSLTLTSSNLMLSIEVLGSGLRVPVSKTSVLLSLSINLSSSIHCLMSQIQFSTAEIASVSLVLTAGMKDK